MNKFFSLFSTALLLFASPLKAEVIEKEHPVLILGGGVAALTSAVYLSRAGITPVVITGPVVGGTITQSHNVQNWPGEVSISGLELGEKVRKQAEMNGALLQSEAVVSVDFSKRPFLVTTKKVIGSDEQLIRYKAQSIIIAMGATPNLLNVPGEQNYWSKGVYSCAVCDGSFYKDKVVAVVGGGDGALVEAEYLSNIAAKVHILVRKGEFRAIEKQRLQEVLARPNVQVHYNTSVKEIQGDESRATHLLLQGAEGQPLPKLPIDALFLAIGAKPNTELFGQLEQDAQGYLVLKNHQETAVPGIYAIGDVADPQFKQAISAAGDAAKAAIQAQRHLASRASQPLTPVKNKQTAKTVAAQAIEVKSKAQFVKELQNAQGPIFVDFYSTRCPPCKMFAPLYDEWARQYGDRIKFLKVNADEVSELFIEYQVRGVPTLLIMDSKGKVARRSTGFQEISEVDKRLTQVKNKDGLVPHDFK
jgi:thioredoxin reductase (NADPH)